MSGIVLIHAGAGYHSLSKEARYKSLCDDASRKAIEKLTQGSSSSEAAVAAMKVLEDSPLTNSGYGSSLTIDGTVECDASMMSSDGYFGAVASMKGVKNPITVAALLQKLQHSPPSDGRVPPSCLVGEGAYSFAQEHNVPTIEPSALISEAAQRSFAKYTKIVEAHKVRKQAVGAQSDEPLARKRKLTNQSEESQISSKLLPTSSNTTDGCILLDTVGVICVDKGGRLSAALSSGGIALKHCGRVGQAAMVGAGCWVEENIAVATTGCGEQLMRTLLAKSLTDQLGNPDEEPLAGKLSKAMKSSFMDSPALKSDQYRLAGVILVHLDSNKANAELLWAHTTKSMCISYMATDDEQPTTLISRLDSGKVSQECLSSGLTISRGNNSNGRQGR